MFLHSQLFSFDFLRLPQPFQQIMLCQYWKSLLAGHRGMFSPYISRIFGFSRRFSEGRFHDKAQKNGNFSGKRVFLKIDNTLVVLWGHGHVVAKLRIKGSPHLTAETASLRTRSVPFVFFKYAKYTVDLQTSAARYRLGWDPDHEILTWKCFCITRM